MNGAGLVLIAGAVRVQGGDARNGVAVGGGSQFMVLGEDDDVLGSGAAADRVGFKTGYHQLFGDNGEMDTLISIERWEIGGKTYAASDTLATLQDNLQLPLADFLVALVGSPSAPAVPDAWGG